MGAFSPALVRANRPSASRITDAVRAALGGYAAIINDAGELAPYVTFTRSSTATRFNSAGLLETVAANQPRYDYDPATLQLRGLLIEEQRTNLLLRSAEFDNASWTKDAGSITASAAVAPDGTLTADKYIPDATNVGTHRVRQLTTNTTAAHSISFYAKADGYNWIKVRLASQFVNFNVATGAIGQSVGGSGVIQSVGNGWYRCTANLVPGSANAFAYIYASTTDDASADTTAFAGNGTSGILIWGAQLEAGAFATSYIPTTTAAVTRAADNASVTALTNIGFNASEGTLVATASWYSFSGGRVMALSGSGFASRLADVYGISPGNVVYYKTTDAVQNTIGTGLAANTLGRISLAYKADDYNGALNGTLGGADTATTGLATVDTLGIGNWNGSGFLNGHIRRLRYYPRRLTNAQLQALTA